MSVGTGPDATATESSGDCNAADAAEDVSAVDGGLAGGSVWVLGGESLNGGILSPVDVDWLVDGTSVFLTVAG